MKLEEGFPGTRIRSRSDGFTRGWVGKIVESARHSSHPDAFFVEWDNGMQTFVACDLVDEESIEA